MQNRPPARLFLTLPDRLHGDILPRLRDVLASVDIACVLFRHLPGQAGGDATTERDLVALFHTHNIAVLQEVHDTLPAAMAQVHRLGLDGLHLASTAGGDFAARIIEARAALGRELILGSECADSRHDAMLAGEGGADYVGFRGGELVARVAWWAELFEVPCVAFDVEKPAIAQEIARKGCEFVALKETVWHDCEDPRPVFEDFYDHIRDVHNV